MKIVQCFFNFEIGGSQVLGVDLMNEMCIENEVFLIIINNEWSDELIRSINKKVTIFYIRRNKGSVNPFPVIRLNWLLFQLNPDVIHCHDPSTARFIVRKKATLIKTIHDVKMPTDYYNLYDVVIAISDAVNKDVSSRFNAVPVKTIYNAIDFNPFKRRLNYDIKAREPFKLVQVSRLVHDKKGQDVLLFALHKLICHYQLTNISLDFVGSGKSLEYLQQLVKKLELENHVNFIGEHDRVWVYQNLHNYHILVQPSKFEGFGLTVVEGFAAGLPVLTSDMDGPAEIISGIEAGFSFKSGDSDKCAKTLLKVFNLYIKGEIELLMSHSYDKIRTKYSIQLCVENYLKQYRNPGSFNQTSN